MAKTGTPTELHVFELDGVLYNNPPPPDASSSWFLSAHSLAGHGQPGFDTRWSLEGVVLARRAILAPSTKTALLTSRPLHVEMSRTVHALLRDADLPFDIVQLRPVSLSVAPPVYKALYLQRWLADYPSVTTVVLHDPDPSCRQALAGAVERAGKKTVAPEVLASAPPVR